MSVRINIASETKQSLYLGRLLLLLFCLMMTLKVVAGSRMIVPGDSSKNKYDINDPRNPHCPCHQYQKLADDEYARLQKEDPTIVMNQQNRKDENATQNDSLGWTDKNPGKQNIFTNIFSPHYKKRKFSGRNSKRTKHRSMKNKISDKLSRCFHF